MCNPNNLQSAVAYLAYFNKGISTHHFTKIWEQSFGNFFVFVNETTKQIKYKQFYLNTK